MSMDAAVSSIVKLRNLLQASSQAFKICVRVHGVSMAIALNSTLKNDRGTRGNRRGRAANICDRSGSSVDERFAGWKASPSCWKDAGEAEWWRHGRCGQVARKDAAGRSPVHPFVPSRPLAAGCPPRHRSLYVHAGVHVYMDTHTYADSSRISLFLSSELSSHSLLLLYLGVPPPLAPRRVVSALDPNASAALTKLPVFVLREIAGYCIARVNTIIDPLHFAPRANENLFL